MARINTKSLFYNFIVAAVLFGLLVLSLSGFEHAAALALEQQARCGLTEHVHTEECYSAEILICGQKAHTHSENCYLVLLEDNDINQLLETVDSTEDKSLESVINSTIQRQLLYPLRLRCCR